MIVYRPVSLLLNGAFLLSILIYEATSSFHRSSAATRAWLVDGEQVYQGEYTDTGELRL